jgi:type II secretory pathway pseudopilin PulG
MFELVLAVTIMGILFAGLFNAFGRQKHKATDRMDNMLAFGQAKRISKAIRNELKSCIKVVKPNGIDSSKFLLIKDKSNTAVLLGLDEQNNFFRYIKGHKETLIRAKNKKIEIHYIRFIRKDNMVEFYMKYRLSKDQVGILEFFDTFKVEKS